MKRSDRRAQGRLLASIAFGCWLCCGSWTATEAKRVDVKFQQVLAQHDFARSTVYSIIQDQAGFLWFGSNDGLQRFDGQMLLSYRHDPHNPQSLSDNTVLALYEDRAGVLWIGTEQGGLNRFDRARGTFTRYQHDPRQPDSLSSNTIRVIYEDSAGRLWLGTDQGLNLLDREQGSVRRYQALNNQAAAQPEHHIHAITEDAAGNLWLATLGNGLIRFQPAAQTMTPLHDDPRQALSALHQNVRALYRDPAGILWIGTDAGLDSFDQQQRQFEHYHPVPDQPDSLSHPQVRAIYADHTGALWFGTHGGGLNRFDRKTKQFTHYDPNPDDQNSLGSNTVLAICESRSGILWVGTQGGGVSFYDREHTKFPHYMVDRHDPYSLSHNLIMAIVENPPGVVWLGTWGGGLYRFDRAQERFTHYQHDPGDPASLSHDSVMAICQDQLQPNLLWIATFGGGLNRFDRTTGHFRAYRADPNDPASLSSDTLWSTACAPSGDVWVGANGGGLNQFDQTTQQFQHYQQDPRNPRSLSDDTVFALYLDPQEVLWVGTKDGGLNQFDRTTGTFSTYRHDPDNPASLSDQSVYAIYADQHGILWIGTMRGGLNKFDPMTQTFVAYRKQDGLPGDAIKGILEDRAENLWISTDAGIAKFERQTGIWKQYDVNDGLQGNEFNLGAYYKNQQGEMFFGGVNGFNVFHPENIRDNPHIPPIVLTSLTQDGKPFAIDHVFEDLQHIVLPKQKNFFEFSFVALNYTKPAANRCAYMLEGFDLEWQYGNSGQYRALPIGAYTLRLKGSNNDGVWNDRGISIRITITPPFWKTNAFSISVIIIVIGLAIGLYRARMHQIESQRQTLEALVAERTAALREQERALSTLVSNLPGIAYRCRNDRDWTVEFISQGCEQLTGYAPAALIHNAKIAYGQLIHPEDREMVWHHIQAALRERRAYQMTYRLITKDNRVKWVWEQGQGIFDDAGTLLALEGLINDVTEQKNLEDALKYAKKQADAANQAKSVFLANMSHELRTPLNAILGFAQLMARDPSIPPKERANLAIIESSGDHLLTLINHSHYALI
ncbi:PAS/PAC sensor signal transduction histidine kinase [Candidatus Vecturithrix granuli]|uniref:PAS/PAC sensor signal transduction histidine kinase n=1 Tax=Vecturithrix granuli TaxID=1499967 RepID=A0A081C4K4_VECG1|nr:PAS/PAC sensor signal transduction histidine kinase [Candidatus Vecturithrix granuli]